MNFSYTYNFKTAGKDLPFADAIAKLESDSQFAAGHLSHDLFDAGNSKEVAKDATKVKLGAKRKSVAVDLSAPDFIESLPKLAQEAVKQVIADFVRATYIDNFLPVGQHDWEFIETEVAKSARAGALPRTPIEDAIWAAAGKSMEDYIMQTLANAGAATRIGAIVVGKFSQNAITKQASEFNTDIVTKLSARLDSWAAWVLENDSDNQEDFAKVYAFCDARLKKHLETLEQDKQPLGAII